MGSMFPLAILIASQSALALQSTTQLPLELPSAMSMQANTPPSTQGSTPPAKPDVPTPMVKIPMSKLTPEAVFPVPGAPDWIAVDEHVWISNAPKNAIVRLDPKANTVAATFDVKQEPCSGLAAGFGSLWVPRCGESNLARLSLKTGELEATIATGVADSEGGIAVGAGSVWLMSDPLSTLVRVDPLKNEVIAKITVATGSYAVAFGEDALWITSTDRNLLTRVDPSTNKVVETIPVGKSPRFLTVGFGSVWTLNQGDGSITRVDAKTNKVLATIEAGISGGGGEIAAGEGSVWATVLKTPITRIDPKTNTVAQQFTGPGGDAIRVGLGSVWLSNLRQHTVWRLDPRKIEAAKAD